jgi:hypothetical protein
VKKVSERDLQAKSLAVAKGRITGRGIADAETSLALLFDDGGYVERALCGNYNAVARRLAVAICLQTAGGW